jgi:peptidylprolyl isomerase
VSFRSRRLAAFVVLPAAFLAACSSGSGSSAKSTPATPSATASGSSAAPSSPAGPPASTTTTTVGVKVSGGFGATPTLTIPATAAPKALTQQTLVPGLGATVAKGDTVIANYVGETWAPKSGAANVFDSSFARSTPAPFVIGEGQVIPGWDKTLVGKHIGTRLLLTVPPADGYGTTGNSQANITATDTLVFVIDLVADYKSNASAPGTVVPNLATAGLPKFTNVPGKEPTITSTAGVKVPTAPISTLVIKGSGAKIDASKTLVLQLVQTDLATGKDTQATWGQAPQTVEASSVFNVADKLQGQNIGARAVALLPATPAVPASASAASQAAAPPEILIIDVIGQY